MTYDGVAELCEYDIFDHIWYTKDSEAITICTKEPDIDNYVIILP